MNGWVISALAGIGWSALAVGVGLLIGKGIALRDERESVLGKLGVTSRPRSTKAASAAYAAGARLAPPVLPLDGRLAGYAEGGHIPPVEPDADSIPVWLTPPAILDETGRYRATSDLDPFEVCCPYCGGGGTVPLDWRSGPGTRDDRGPTPASEHPDCETSGA